MMRKELVELAGKQKKTVRMLDRQFKNGKIKLQDSLLLLYMWLRGF
jgi:hypothetical protein